MIIELMKIRLNRKKIYYQIANGLVIHNNELSLDVPHIKIDK